MANAANHNLVGVPITDVFVTDANHISVLADNGGPAKTVALIAEVWPSAEGAALPTVTADNGTSLSVNDIMFIAGELLKIGTETVEVTGITRELGHTGNTDRQASRRVLPSEISPVCRFFRLMISGESPAPPMMLRLLN